MKLLEVKFGSHLYGTNTPDSDLDLKGLYLPNAKDIVLGRVKDVIQTARPKAACERNTKDDVDIEIFSLDRFVSDLMAGQTWALDLLFAPPESYTYCSDQGAFLMNELMHFKDRLLTKNINAFVGYARKQAAKYGIKGSRLDALKRTVAVLETIPPYDKLDQPEHLLKLNKLVEETAALVSLEQKPLITLEDVKQVSGEMLLHLQVCGRKIAITAARRYATDCYAKILAEYGSRAHKAHLAGGVDWKALSHAVRVNGEALELLKTGTITFPRPDRELLLQIKLGALTYDYVADLIERGLAELEETHKTCGLRDTPDRDWADELIFREYSRIVREAA